MESYKIADLIVNYEPKFKLLRERSEQFKTEFTEKCNIEINIPLEFIEQKQRENPKITIEESEYLFLGGAFFRKLVNFGGCLLHSSTVVLNNEAYMFSANPNTGKSTHTSLWLKEFGERAYILNDDKPAIKCENGVLYACGTPFSGKSDLSVNKKVPVKAIYFLERAKENSVEKMSVKEALPLFLGQTHRIRTPEENEKFMALLNEIFTAVPFFRLRCNMEQEAARVAYGAVLNK